MIFVFGPMFSGKREYVMKALRWNEDDLSEHAVTDAHLLAAENDDINALAEKLSHKQVVIADEIGGGVVPTAPEERRIREASGRLCCLLAEKAESVIRVYMGIPQVLKGKGFDN